MVKRNLNLNGWAIVLIKSDRLKTTREALCIAQTMLPKEESILLEHLIEQIDILRPLGSDGKHGDLHTAACGCKDK